GFIINNVFITPDLGDTILNGVTRSSVITILKDMGIKTEERRISIDEVVEAYNNGTLNEIFGMGTAAVISLIKELKYKDVVMHFDTSKFTTALKVKHKLNEIRHGLVADKYGWMFKI